MKIKKTFVKKTLVLAGIDWGTTHRRTYALDAAGQCTQELSDSDGALACQGNFPGKLNEALIKLPQPPQMIILSGMVGSALGWHNVPYLDHQVALQDLHQYLFRVQDSQFSGACAIVPGYCIRNTQGQPDVMRGEETQLLGACALGHRSGWFVLPGTHSKWVELHEGKILQLRTYMTGELFHLLSHHGTLAASMGADSAWSDAAFAAGVHAAKQGVLALQLFSGRAKVVCGDMPACDARAYLSGVLIGSELHDVFTTQALSTQSTTFKIIASPDLAMRYQQAAQLLPVSSHALDSKDVFLAAMRFFQNHWSPT